MEDIAKASLAGISCALSSSLLNPIDVTKIKLQNQPGVPVPGVPHYKGLLDGVTGIFRAEGFRGFVRGIEPSIMREMTYSSCRMGAYEPVRGVLMSLTASNSSIDSSGSGNGSGSDAKEYIPPSIKFLSAMLCGGIGAAISNPFDLIKTRFQAVFPGDAPLPYNNTFQAMRYIIQHEGGVAGLYKGWQVTCGRAACLTSGQLGTYDVIKNNVLIQRLNFNEKENGVLLHLVSAMTASIIATTAANPCDVIKSRYQADGTGANKRYSSLMHCIQETLRLDGLQGFLRGWTASYWRIGPHTVFSLVLFERARKLFGFDPI